MNVLLFTTQRWPNTALLALALRRAGLTVRALCPTGHPVRAASFIAPERPYRRLLRFSRLEAALQRGPVDLVVPGDDAATEELHALHRRTRDPHVRALIERSLGDPRYYRRVLRKSEVVALAARLGVATPATVQIDSREALQAQLAHVRWPVLIKADGWCGGRGNRLVRSPQEALAAFDELPRPQSWATALKDSARENSLQPLMRRLEGRAPAVTLQEFVSGRPVNRAVVCRRGEVLDGRTFEAVQCMPNFGHATVVRPRRLPQAERAAETLTAALGLSGLAGFDFIYDEACDRLWLLELNPRATSACHLAPDAAAPLVAALPQLMRAPRPGRPRHEALDSAPLIALFPDELARDRASSLLARAEHPIPWDEPELVLECLRRAVRPGVYERFAASAKGALAHPVIGLRPARAPASLPN